MGERLYHVVLKDDKTGAVVRMSTTPMPHGQASTMLSKQSHWKQPAHRRFLLEEVRPATGGL